MTKTISSSWMVWSFEPNRYFRPGIALNPGTPVQATWSVLFTMPLSTLASPSRSRMTCSLVFWAMIGSVTPLMVEEPFSELSSILIFSVTSRSK